MDSLNPIALVTGGAGFIGSHLTEHLVSNGWRVRVLDDLSTGHRENLAAVSGRIEFILGSITDKAAVVRAVAGVEVVFHLAAKVFVPESFEKPADYERVNVRGTALLLDAARKAGVRRVVFSSTCAVYGDTTDLPIAETAPTKPMSPYAANKLAAEELGRKAAATGGPAFTALRYFNVYGPRQDPRSAYSGVITRFSHVVANKLPPTIYGDGGQTRDFVFVGDVAIANLLAAGHMSGAHAIYNVGTSVETSIKDLWRMIAQVKGAKQEPQFLHPRAGDILRSVADIREIREKLGFSPTTAIADGIRDMLAT
jgi:UDP-glucose 4-epimerase